MASSKVQLILIGAGRSGTTSLADWLGQHPQIQWSRVKEVPYFTVTDLYERGQSYLDRFFRAAEGGIRATSDTHLLAAPLGPERVNSYNPDCKIVVLLRDPVERAYSAYRYSVAAGYHPDYGFKHVLEKEDITVATGNPAMIANHAHLYVSRYGQHLERWSQYFEASQFLVLTTQELQQDPDNLMRKVERFARLKHFDDYNFVRKNERQGFKSAALHRFLANRDHPLRKATRWMIRPFQQTILKSGVVERIKTMNKTDQNAERLDREVYEKLRATLSDDLALLEGNWGIKL